MPPTHPKVHARFDSSDFLDGRPRIHQLYIAVATDKGWRQAESTVPLAKSAHTNRYRLDCTNAVLLEYVRLHPLVDRFVMA
jgi:hypothetical protein